MQTAAQSNTGNATPVAGSPPFDTARATGETAQQAPRPVEYNQSSASADDTGFGLDKASAKMAIIASLTFLLVFLMMALGKLYYDQNKYHLTATSGLQANLDAHVDDASQTLAVNVSWINSVLGTQGQPMTMIEELMRGEQVVGAAFLNSDGRVVATSPNAGDALSRVDIQNLPQSGIRITSLIAQDGTINPIIVQRVGEIFLVVALAPNSLAKGTPATPVAIITPGSRVIDGFNEIGITGPAEYFDLSVDRLSTITKTSAEGKVDAHVMKGKNIWLASKSIPNSSLTLLTMREKTLSSDIIDNLLFFAALFGVIFLFVGILVRQLMVQIKQLHETNRQRQVSQQRFSAAIDGSRGGIWEIDQASNTAYISQSLCRLIGLADMEQTIPLPNFLALFHESDRERLYSMIRRAHMSGEFDVDVKVARLPITLSCRGRPSVRGSDAARVVIGMAIDVTEQRGAQTRLQAAETRLHNALHSMTDSFIVWDPLKRLVLWNGKYEDFFGFQPGILQPGIEYANIEYYAMQNVTKRFPLADNVGFEILLKDGRWIRYLETYTPDGSQVGIGTDITEIRLREHQLENNQQALETTISVLQESQVRIVELAENYEQEKIRAEEANQSKSDFLANMSHELRTPLNAINGFSDIMKKEMFGPLGDPRYREYVNDILFSGQHLLSLINDILDMSKIEAGKMTLNTEVMQVTDLVQQVIRIVRGRAEENRLKLIFSETELPEIHADPRAVKQVLLNLLTNAIKFTPEGGVVSVETAAKSAGLIIKVSDSGIGIAQENIDRLAKPFEQIESEHSRQHEGTGLGLALSKSLVELHGGNFVIESVLGEGTTVIFTLPNKPPEVEAPQEDNQVGSEISRLAKDIANVLTDNGVMTNPATPPSPQQISPQHTPNITGHSAVAPTADILPPNPHDALLPLIKPYDPTA